MIIERHCPHCRQPILDGTIFCLDCGARIPAKAPTAVRSLKESDLVKERSVDGDLESLPVGDYLLVTEGLDQGRRFKLTERDIWIIGRESADINLDDPFVSRHHAEIRRQGGRYLLIDGGSANGTYVNSERADRREVLDGDVIEVGYTVLVFHTKP